MNNTLKQSKELDTNSRPSNFKRAIVHLSVYYSIGVFFVLLVSSLFVYGLFVQKLTSNFLEEQEKVQEKTLEEVFQRKSDFNNQAKNDLFNIILLSNVLLVVFSISIAYFFSRKTLAPLEISYKKQKIFLADAARELGKRLIVLDSNSEVLLQKNSDITEYKKVTEESLKKIDSLIELSNNLLFLAQNSDSVLKEKIKFSLSQICQKKVEQMSMYAQTKNIAVTVNIEQEIYMSGKLDDIALLLVNLIKNAIDYNFPNGKMFVSLKKDRSKAILSIEDTGMGINKKDAPHIFDRFYKSETQSLGVGLGLAIVKEIVDQHKGTIRVESEVNGGTRVTVFFSCR